jgi:hypothetical protein
VVPPSKPWGETHPERGGPARHLVLDVTQFSGRSPKSRSPLYISFYIHSYFSFYFASEEYQIVRSEQPQTPDHDVSPLKSTVVLPFSSTCLRTIIKNQFGQCLVFRNRAFWTDSSAIVVKDSSQPQPQPQLHNWSSKDSGKSQWIKYNASRAVR